MTLEAASHKESSFLGFRVCLEGQGDLVSGLIRGITRTIWVIGVISLLTKSP